MTREELIALVDKIWIIIKLYLISSLCQMN